MEFDFLRYEEKDGVAVVTLNRPRAMNALNLRLIDELTAAVSRLEDNTDVRGVIITGEGSRAFAAGADISEMKDLSAMQAREMALKAHRLMNMVEHLPVPVVAAVNGYALGGGCELAMACDIRIAAESARMGQPEVSLGIIPGFGGTQRLPRLVGRGAARYLIMTGDIIDASEALRIGLVERVVPDAELIEACRDVLGRIMSGGPFAVELAKKAVAAGMDTDLSSALSIEAELFALTFAGDEQKEGMSAFLEKRTADFRRRRIDD